MKQLIYFVCILTFITSSSQQMETIDSLKSVMSNLNSDTTTIRVLNKLASEYWYRNPDSTRYYSKQAFNLADSIGKDGRAGIALNNIGNIYFAYANYPKALDYYLRALDAQKSTQNQQAISMCFANIGLVYSSIGDTAIAIDFYDSALQIKEEIGDLGGIANALYNVGTIYGDGNEKQINKALSNFRRALKINLQLGDRRSIAFCNASVGIIHQKKNNFDSSNWYYNQALNIQEQLGDENAIAITNYNLAKLFHEQGSHREARRYADKVIQISNSIRSYDLIRDGAWMMMDIEESAGNTKKAFEYAKILLQAKDSLFNEEKSREIGRLESQFELDKSLYQNQLKESENELLKEEAAAKQRKLETQSAVLIVSVLILFSFIVFAFILRKRSIERKKLLEEIQRQSQKLKELDQAKTRFFANISHDLRSPLTLILGSLDKITERDYDILDSESKEMLDMGMKNGKRLLYLADEIMDLTRLEEGKINLNLEYVKIVPYLRLLTKMFSSAADIKSISLKFEAKAEDESILQLDPHQFEKIIYNLLSNAIKFTPENGNVNVSIQSDNQHVEIEISDSGTGIPEESLDLIFDRYYQSSNTEHASQSGVGIGLALVKELVELHGGTVAVSSSEKGTSFVAKFPFKENDWVSQAIVPERSLDVVTRNSLWMDLQEEHERIQVASLSNDSPDAKTVLIVEDHKELRFYLKSILSSDFRVFLAANGTHGLEVLQSEKIDLIITDLMMPYMDGFEFIDHLKNDKDLRKIPVLVVSARTDKDEKIELIKKGADDVISKPFDKEELFARISNILSRDWDSIVKLTKLYGETAEEFEKSIMAKMERLIIKRIDDPHLTVLDLADEMAASERKVYRMIKKISGLTPYELIKEVRWQYLKDYLKNNKVKTATEAANLIGMNNVSSFSDQYKKRFGSSIKDVLMEN
jgi:signal transduction histidine kinase/DNA-binding NarL/FixJ family response regulator